VAFELDALKVLWLIGGLVDWLIIVRFFCQLPTALCQLIFAWLMYFLPIANCPLPTDI